MAISGLTESLLTVDSVSNKLNEPGDKGKETLAQGIGNIVSGLFGTMGGCVLVGQTNLNIGAGAKHRLSSLVAALGLAVIILVFGEWIERLPLAGLIGVMMVVVYQTGAWSSLHIKKIKHLSIITTTVLVSLATSNLAIGVIFGTLVFYFSKILKHDAIKN
jgi:SulP family sulfate permease